ncbi:MAG: PDZ domain-containing protein [Deferribacteres bacterium]|nr:PDZ domain-containing protein [Deferribacteres bacterium]
MQSKAIMQLVKIIILFNLLIYSLSAKDPELLTQVKITTPLGLPLLHLNFANGKTGQFILDTGFDINVIDASFVRELHLKVENPQKVLQPGGYIEMGEIKEFSFQLGDIIVDKLGAQSAPLAQLAQFIGVKFHGILGHQFIERYILRLNYEDGDILVYSSNDEFPAEDYRVVPIRIVKGEVLMPFSIRQLRDKGYSAEIKLDTGSIDGIAFALNFYEDANLEKSAPNYLKTIGVGGGGTTIGRVFKIDLLNFASTQYRSLIAGVTIEAAGTERRENAGTMGAAILARQDLILDYAHERIMLGSVYEKPVGLPDDNSGLFIIEPEGKKVVFQVYENSPAIVAGLQSEDEILSVNDKDAAAYSLDEIYRVIRGDTGKSVKLTYKRNGVIKTTQLVLQDLFTKQ